MSNALLLLKWWMGLCARVNSRFVMGMSHLGTQKTGIKISLYVNAKIYEGVIAVKIHVEFYSFLCIIEVVETT